jgi:hypothetical protein
MWTLFLREGARCWSRWVAGGGAGRQGEQVATEHAPSVCHNAPAWGAGSETGVQGMRVQVCAFIALTVVAIFHWQFTTKQRVGNTRAQVELSTAFYQGNDGVPLKSVSVLIVRVSDCSPLQVELSAAFYEVYDGAVYLFQGRPYLCKVKRGGGGCKLPRISVVQGWRRVWWWDSVGFVRGCM